VIVSANKTLPNSTMKGVDYRKTQIHPEEEFSE
jgi:hypothetical protein